MTGAPGSVAPMAAASSRRLQRFGRTERTLHWVHAAAFCVLLGSGLCMYLPSLAEVVGRRPLLKTIHLYTALGWAIAIVLILALGNRRALLATLHEVEYFDADDGLWLLGQRTPQGRLNAGQKLNTIVTAVFAILFAISGFFLWYGERDTTFQNPDALLLHDWLTYVALILFVGHLYLTLILPKTRHSLSGMTRGWVREDWAIRHHPKWVDAIDEPATAVRGPRQPRVLFSDPGSGAVVVDLRHGERLGSHQISEHAVMEVSRGRILVECAGEAIELEAGALVRFDPGEPHAFRALSDALLLFRSSEDGSPEAARQAARGAAQSPVAATPAWVLGVIVLVGLVLFGLLVWLTGAG
jgi:formate dehydrogenase subunit gamma